MSKAALTHLQLICLALLLAFIASLSPGPALPAVSARMDDSSMVILFLAPLVEIYEGDTISLPYVIEDLSDPGGVSLAPLTPGKASASAQLGTISIAPAGLSGTITYTARNAGQEQVALTVTNYFGTAEGTTEFEVKPRPNYDLSFLIINEDSDEAGGAFRAVFSGEGQFANVDDLPLEGKGSSDLWFALWVTNEAFVCRMDPPIKGSSPFEILPGPIDPLASLVRPPGYIDPFTIDLAFEPVSLNASTLKCHGLGDITATIPWPASKGNPDEHNLKGLTFPGEGGIIHISGSKTRGYVLVTRKE